MSFRLFEWRSSGPIADKDTGTLPFLTNQSASKEESTANCAAVSSQSERERADHRTASNGRKARADQNSAGFSGR